MVVTLFKVLVVPISLLLGAHLGVPRPTYAPQSSFLLSIRLQAASYRGAGTS